MRYYPEFGGIELMEQTSLFENQMVKQRKVIKSISYSQEEIIQWIMDLYCPNGFELDPTYSKGYFYKKLPEPKLKFDIEPQVEGVEQADCQNLPIRPDSVNSIMFDPPFVAGFSNKSDGGIIRKRFGSYKTIQHELWTMYRNALKEFYRILRPNGILVFKCQDVIDSSKQYLSHVEIINYAVSLGFYPKDLFVFLAKKPFNESKSV